MMEVLSMVIAATEMRRMADERERRRGETREARVRTVRPDVWRRVWSAEDGVWPPVRETVHT